MAQEPRTFREFQSDFSGGANAFTNPALLQPNEAASLINLFPRMGGGVEARKGWKSYDGAGSTDQGTAIFEMNQSTGTILTFVAVGANWYDETMWPRYRLFNQTPGINDAAYFGAREPFNQLILYLIAGYVPAAALQGLVFEYFEGGDYTQAANWTDFTASVVAATPDDKKLAAAAFPREVVLSWPTPTSPAWVAGQVETRGYQYWIRIRVTVDIQNGGSDVVVGQRRVTGDWVGRRHLMTADTGHLWEWPALTVTRRGVETWPTGQRIPRLNAATINDHLYYSSDGQRPLQRWNGSRGVTRAGGTNLPSAAGLTAPSAAPTLTQPTANATAFPNGDERRYRLAFEYGPAGILGESPPSTQSLSITIAAGPNNIRVSIAAAVTQAASIPVSAILVYRTVNLAGTTIDSVKNRIQGYLQVKRILRDDADWNAGFWEDTYVSDVQKHPIEYVNAPPFYPKGVVVGAERVWIWNELFVAWSDIGRGDSWDPANQKQFPDVKGIIYRKGKLYVFHSEDISTIELPPVGLPDIQFFWRGIGNVQPDTITIHEDEIHFVSKQGPARVIGNRVELTAKGRQFETGGYWRNSAAQRRLASAAAFDGRVWFAVDSSGTGPAIQDTVTLDLLVNEIGAWSRQAYNKAAGGPVQWGTYGVVHAPLDHPLARQSILLAFPDGSYPTIYYKLALLEYGTTDDWGSVATDGTSIGPSISTRAITLRAADRFKEFQHGHVLLRFRRTAAGGITATMYLTSNHGETASKQITYTPNTIDNACKDVRFITSEASSAGRYRAVGPSLFVTAATDTGFQLLSWLLRGSIERFRVP